MTPIWTIDGYFFRPRNMLYSHTVQQWAGNYPFQSSGLIENWSEQLKHWLSKQGEIESWQSGVWLTHLSECANTHWTWVELKRVSLMDRRLFFWWIWGQGKDADVTMHFLLRKDDAGKIIILSLSFFLTSPQLFFPTRCSGHRNTPAIISTRNRDHF